MPTDGVNVGDVFWFEKTVSAEDVVDFGRISGDDQEIHYDPEVAELTIFEEPPSQGMLTLSYVSAVLGNEVPLKLNGEYIVLRGLKEVEFHLPVYPGDMVRTKCAASSRENRLLWLDIVSYTDRHGDNPVLTGQVKTLSLQFKKSKAA